MEGSVVVLIGFFRHYFGVISSLFGHGRDFGRYFVVISSILQFCMSKIPGTCFFQDKKAPAARCLDHKQLGVFSFLRDKKTLRHAP